LSLSIRFPHQNPAWTSPVFHTCSMPRPSHSWFVTSLSSCEEFRNMVIFYGEELLALRPTPPTGGPLPVGCSRLLIQYVCSYPPYLEAVLLSATRRRAMLWWQEPTLQGVLSFSCFNRNIHSWMCHTLRYPAINIYMFSLADVSETSK
jgi:hypothetical protein